MALGGSTFTLLAERGDHVGQPGLSAFSLTGNDWSSMIVAAHSAVDGVVMASAKVARIASSPTDSVAGQRRKAGHRSCWPVGRRSTPEARFSELRQLLGFAHESGELTGCRGHLLVRQPRTAEQHGGIVGTAAGPGGSQRGPACSAGVGEVHCPRWNSCCSVVITACTGAVATSPGLEQRVHRLCQRVVREFRLSAHQGAHCANALGRRRTGQVPMRPPPLRRPKMRRRRHRCSAAPAS